MISVSLWLAVPGARLCIVASAEHGLRVLFVWNGIDYALIIVLRVCRLQFIAMLCSNPVVNRTVYETELTLCVGDRSAFMAAGSHNFRPLYNVHMDVQDTRRHVRTALNFLKFLNQYLS